MSDTARSMNPVPVVRQRIRGMGEIDEYGYAVALECCDRLGRAGIAAGAETLADDVPRRNRHSL